MKSSLMSFGFSLLMGSMTLSPVILLQASQNSQKQSKKDTEDVLDRVATAHGKELLARTNMLAEGTVTLYSDNRPTVLKVTLLRNGERESQRILLELAGKPWDGRGGSLTPDGKRALDFLETQYARGPRKLLKTSPDALEVTASNTTVTIQEKEGEPIAYFLDSATSRLVHFEFERGQYRDTKGHVRPNVHSYAYSDYRSTDGIATPYRVEHDTNGIKQEELLLATARYIAATSAPQQ